MSIANISNTKSVLAKLLAQENLTVEHRKVHTAMFDPINRVLTLPIWREMSSDLYDLLVGHEVGHAWETPPKGWHNAIEEKGRGFKSFLNVVEDARIEKRIKNRYPGLRGPFYKAYKELMERDFFGVKERPVTSLQLIDRINLHYKIGHFLNIPFKTEEKHFLDRMDNLQTWDDVYQLASELYQYSKEQPTTSFDDMFYSEDLSGEEEYSEEYEDTDNEGNEELPDRSGGCDFDPESLTDRNFRENESKLLSGEIYPYVYAYLPEFDYKDFIIDYKKLYSKTDFSSFDNYEEIVKLNFSSIGSSNLELLKKESLTFNAGTLILEYKEKNHKFIMYLVKEFELKRNAAQYARASVSKTGELDVDKVWSYKLKEDLFKRVTKIPNGKNHGMVMFVDWSGSMSNNMESTLEQTLVLADFCRKVKIPFEVFAFTDTRKSLLFNLDSDSNTNKVDSYKFSSLPKDLYVDSFNFSLMNLLSYRMSNQDYRKAQIRLLQIGRIYEKNRNLSYDERFILRGRQGCIPDGWSLSGTPLNETIIVATRFVEAFKTACKLDVVNTIFLTDGDGSPMNTIFTENGRNSMKHVAGHFKYNLVLKDRKTGITVFAKPEEQTTSALLRMLKLIANTRLVGYYIMESSPRYSINYLARQYGQELNLDDVMKNMRKNKYFLLEGTGYDSYFLVSGKDLKILDNELDVKSDNTKKEVIKEFIKFQKNKILNRILLNNFIDKIA